ncbi:protein-tyrosine phosphatase-like protein [Amylocystis lapponica]|nr:protein-tyrosine phosphatase-like protein [Amylocystis lapponica]
MEPGVTRATGNSSQSTSATSNNLDEVDPGIYLGNAFAARAVHTLKKHGISRVVTAMKDFIPPAEYDDIVRMIVPVDDWPDDELLCHFEPVINFINAAKGAKTPVLVHCQQGASRSASLVAAYLMYTFNLSVSEAIDRLKMTRSLVCPNQGFLDQLRIFEACNCRLGSVTGQEAIKQWRKQRDVAYAAKVAVIASQDGG